MFLSPPVEKLLESAKRRPFCRVRTVLGGKTAVILGGGPSLSKAQIDTVSTSGVFTVAINNAVFVAPWAHLLYFADAHWYRWQTAHAERRKALRKFKGEILTIENFSIPREDRRVMTIRRGEPGGVSNDRCRLSTGGNSGYQCINLLALAGASKIVLLGFDMRVVNGKSHFMDHRDKRGQVIPTPSEIYKDVFLPRFPVMAAILKSKGVRVINATPGTALKAFERMSLEEAMKA